MKCDCYTCGNISFSSIFATCGIVGLILMALGLFSPTGTFSYTKYYSLSAPTCTDFNDTSVYARDDLIGFCANGIVANVICEDVQNLTTAILDNYDIYRTQLLNFVSNPDIQKYCFYSLIGSTVIYSTFDGIMVYNSIQSLEFRERAKICARVGMVLDYIFEGAVGITILYNSPPSDKSGIYYSCNITSLNNNSIYDSDLQSYLNSTITTNNCVTFFKKCDNPAFSDLYFDNLSHFYLPVIKGLFFPIFLLIIAVFVLLYRKACKKDS